MELEGSVLETSLHRGDKLMRACGRILGRLPYKGDRRPDSSLRDETGINRP